MIPCTKKLGRRRNSTEFFTFFVLSETTSDVEATDGLLQLVGELRQCLARCSDFLR